MVSTVYGDYVLHEYYLSLYICRYTGEFLRDQAPLVIKKPDPAEPEVCRRAYMTTAANQFSMKTSGFIVQVHAWYTQMESKLVNNLRFDEKEFIVEILKRWIPDIKGFDYAKSFVERIPCRELCTR